MEIAGDETAARACLRSFPQDLSWSSRGPKLACGKSCRRHDRVPLPSAADPQEGWTSISHRHFWSDARSNFCMANTPARTLPLPPSRRPVREFAARRPAQDDKNERWDRYFGSVSGDVRLTCLPSVRRRLPAARASRIRSPSNGPV
jgi:hypothetical protein